MATYHPTLKDMRRLVGRGKTVPVVRRLLADHMTPVSAFARLSDGAEHAFLLESVVGGEQIARYSFVAARPTSVFRVKGDTAWIERQDGGHREITRLTDPLMELQAVLDEFKAVPREEMSFGLTPLPRFTGGAVGWAGYDTIRYFENLPHSPTDDRGLDDLSFGIYDAMVIFDHVNKTILVVAHARLDGSDVAADYDQACRRIDEMVETLNRPAEGMASDLDLDAPTAPTFSSSLSREQFEDAVRRSIEYIVAGDIFQVVLSQRLRVSYAADPFDIYRALRVVNPSPFMFYVKSPQCLLVGASPEILCRVEEGVVTNRPLAGTRRRGATEAEDLALEKELLADPKDRAEHIMLVDLGRNDVGRVAEAGSVKLTELMSVERYSHVMHISSNVTGKLADGRTSMDVLRAALPVGTVSGAPKIRAMQIIDELEPVRRGPYGGAVGYFDFAGNMDTCIALRTMVVTPDSAAGRLWHRFPTGAPQGSQTGATGRAGAEGAPSLPGVGDGLPDGSIKSDTSTVRSPGTSGSHRLETGATGEPSAPTETDVAETWTVDIQAGAGIVADSDPASEFEETLNKAKALLAAIAIAERRG